MNFDQVWKKNVGFRLYYLDCSHKRNKKKSLSGIKHQPLEQ